MNSFIEFQSPLADGIKQFLTCHRALHKRFKTEEFSLRLLDRYLIEKKITSMEVITAELLDDFLLSRPRKSRSYNHLLNVLQRFFNWMVAQRELTISPLRTKPRRATRYPIPYIFKPEQIKRLLEAASQLPDNPFARNRSDIYPMIFILMYGLGLRVSEVTRLCHKDINMVSCYLIIRQTKFAKSRLVPFGPKLAERLAAYLERQGTPPPDRLVFSFSRDHRLPIRRQTVSRTFQQLLPELAIKLPAGVARVRLHCLRHSFAVGTLLRWYQEGKDPSQHLIYLSTFLGHVNPTSTAIYLTITGDLLEEASQRFHEFMAPILEEVEL